MLQDVDSLDPFLGISVPAVQLFRLTYDYLTDYSPVDNRPVPGLARSWTTSADGRTWTFRIRDGVRWSDGQPLTAEDLAFTYRTIMRHPTMPNAAAVRTFTSVTATGPDVLVIRTAVPTPTMLALDIPIVPAHVWQGKDPSAEPGDTAALVGSGPFRLVEAHASRYYRLERNPAYWRGAPKTEQVVYQYFSDSDSAVQALRKGEVDVAANLTPAQFDALAGDRRVGRNEARGTRFTELAFNPGAARADGTPVGDGHPALRDVRVRAAIEHAIDRDALVARVLGGHGDAGGGYLPATFAPWGWQPGPGVRRRFDPALANRLLDQAGYRRGPDGVRVMPGNGRKLAFRLFAPSERAHYQQSATRIAAWLARVGITVRVQTMSGNQISARTLAGRYDMFLGGWVLDPDPDFLLSVQTCGTRPDAAGNGTTDSFECDPTYDRMYGRQARDVDRVERVGLVQRMQRRLYADADQVILYYPAVLEAYRSDLFTGFVRRPTGTGSIAGPWSYPSVAPVAQPTPGRRGPGAGLAWGVAAGTLLCAAVAAAVWRRRATRGLRE